MRMNKSIILAVIFIITIGLAFSVSVNFKDASTSGSYLTQTNVSLTYQKLCQEWGGTGYPAGAATGRYKVQFYKSGSDGHGGDHVISALDPVTHQPTGDDVALTNSNNFQDVTITAIPSRPWGPTTAIDFQAVAPAVNGHVGDMIFCVIFNSTSIAYATKYMVLNSLYTVTSTATQAVLINSLTWVNPTGMSNWVSFAPPNPIISGNISSSYSLAGVTLSCTGTYTGTQITTDGAFAFSIPTGNSITITPTKTGYVFSPVNYVNANVTENVSNIVFTMIKSAPNNASLPVPSNTSTNIPVTVGKVGWSYTPNAAYSLPTGFKVYFPATATPVVVPYQEGLTSYEFAIPLLSYNTLYSWKVVPTNGNPSKNVEGTLTVSRTLSGNSKADSDGLTEWSFTTESPQIIEPGITEVIDPDGTNGSLGNFNFNTPSPDVAPTTPYITYTIIPVANVPFLVGSEYMTSSFALNLSASVSTPLTVTIPTGLWFVNAYYAGEWHHGNPYPAIGVSVVTFDNIPFGGKGNVEMIFSQGGDPTLPVELSSFTAIFSESFFVQLTWVVQSETNHLGYNILRSESTNLEDAVMLNDGFISSGTESGTQITYSFRDDQELEENTTYHYWLNSVDLDGTQYFVGPVNVLVSNGGEPPTPPVIPTRTELLSAYPNPFDISMSTTLQYNLKVKSSVKLDIYNVKGQVIWSNTNNNPKVGYNKIEWNGKDNNGNQVSSGIYFYRMTSGKYTASKKIILVK